MFPTFNGSGRGNGGLAELMAGGAGLLLHRGPAAHQGRGRGARDGGAHAPCSAPGPASLLHICALGQSVVA